MNYTKNVWKSLPTYLKTKSIIIFILILISTSLEVLGIGLVVPVILFFIEDNISNNHYFLHSITSYFFINPDKSDYIKFGLISILIVYLVKNLFLGFFALYESKFTHEVRKSISKRLFNYYLNQDLKFHNKINSAKLINILTKEIPIFTNALIHMLIISTEICVFIGVSILLIYFAPKGFLIVSSICFIVISAYNFFTSKKLTYLGEQRQKSDTLVIQKIQQGLGGLREIKIYNREPGFYSTFKNSVFTLYHISWVSDFIHKLPRLLLEFATVLSLVIIVILFINFNNDLKSLIVVLGLFALSAVRILPSLSRIYNAYQRIKFGEAATFLICKELQMFEKNKKVFDIKNNEFYKKNINKLEFKKSIKFSNLSFSHSEQKNKIFNKVNLEIKKGQIVGITGPSGSGKSTLADLILGLINPNEGKVLVDDCDILSMPGFWKSKAGYVPQNIFLTDDKLSRNIALGLDDADIDNEKLKASIKSVELDVFINSLPNGLSTSVGERGSRISGGQKQRIGLSRALYSDPQLLILDETTNALDKETEKKILETIFKIKNNRTIIFISHDINLLKNFDAVYKINDKKIIKIN